jgi:hypothetical protein
MEKHANSLISSNNSLNLLQNLSTQDIVYTFISKIDELLIHMQDSLKDILQSKIMESNEKYFNEILFEIETTHRLFLVS